MNQEKFLPGFEPENKKDNTIEKKVDSIKITYATPEERVRCQYCEDVGICDNCQRGIDESARLLDLKRQG